MEREDLTHVIVDRFLCGTKKAKYLQKSSISVKLHQPWYICTYYTYYRNSFYDSWLHSSYIHIPLDIQLESGAAEPGGQGGHLPTQLLDPYVLSHATSFITLFSACPPSFKLLPRPLNSRYILITLAYGL